jgi:hypothetical protein
MSASGHRLVGANLNYEAQLAFRHWLESRSQDSQAALSEGQAANLANYNRGSSCDHKPFVINAVNEPCKFHAR